MKKVEKEYIPEQIAFKLPENSVLPEIIGKVKTLEKCQELIGKSFVATNTKYTAIHPLNPHNKQKLDSRAYKQQNII